MDTEKHKLFLKLILEHQPKIYAYILTLVPSYPDADDILQNACEIMWRRFDQFEPGTNFLAWAIKCAYFEIINFRKNKAKSREIVFDSETFEQMLPVLNDEIKTIDHRREALEQCLDKLQGKQRDIIKLRYNMDLRPKDIALRMGYTVANMYKLISRIQKKLLSCIERNTNRIYG